MIMRGQNPYVYSVSATDRIAGWANDFSLDPIGDMG
jgi:hypothetical protein